MQGLSKAHCTVRKDQKKDFMYYALRHVSITVSGLCYLTGCTEHIARHYIRFHGQKNLDVSNALLERFVVHPDMREPFIAFSRGRGMTDEQEVSMRKTFAEKKFLLPAKPQVMIG